MKRIILLILLNVVVTINLFSAPSWVKSSFGNGQLRGDGQLNKRFALGNLCGSPEFAFPVTLEHEISNYPYDEYPFFSQWRVPQVTTYVAPFGGDVFWLSPSGEEYYFKPNDETYRVYDSRPSRIASEYAAVRGNKDEPDRIYIITKDKWVYSYEKGVLHNLLSPSGRRLYFKTDGIKILSIEQRLGTKTIVLLDTVYDNSGRLTCLKLGPVWHNFAYVEDSELLKSWQVFGLKERETIFDYREGIISKITYPNTKKEHFAWQLDWRQYTNDENLNVGDIKPNAILLSDSDYIYAYGKNKAGINLVKTNLLGHKDRLIYNPLTSRLTSVDPAGATTSVVWGRGYKNEATGKLKEIVSAKGIEMVKLEYDDKGRIISMIKRGEAPVTYKYDDLDRITEVKNGKYQPTKYYYDGESMRPVKIINPLGESIDFKYAPDGQILSYKNGEGAMQTYTYNELGRMTRRNFPHNVWIAWEYDDLGRVIARTYSNKNKFTCQYDEFNQLKTAADNKIRWRYSYYPSGRIKQITRNGMKWLEVQSEILNDTEYLTLIDAKKSETKKTLSLDGELMEEINPLKETIKYKYNPVGKLTGWEDHDGSTVKFDYDERGKMIFHENDIGQTIEISYDEFGNFVERQTQEQIIKIDYDDYDRPIMRTYANGQTIAYVYDEYGRVGTVKTEGLTCSLEYDALNRITERKSYYDDGAMAVLKVSYNKAGLRRSVMNTVFDANKIERDRSLSEYSYDMLGRPTETLVNGARQLQYFYDESTQMLLCKRMANGAQTIYSYDEEAKPIQSVSYDGNLNPVGGVKYTWSNFGELVNKSVYSK